jgi:peptidoglycan/xylan/chitin deacetylase (PgdA/CDA1 family)
MALILLYHRVADLASDPQRLAVSPDRFGQHLEILNTHFSPMSLPELVERAHRKSLPPESVALTFDDGYADNLENAKPLLERWRVPATVFVTTDYVGGDREFWWDDLERVLLTEGRLPTLLRLQIGTLTREWDLGGAAEWSAAMCRQHMAWHVERKDDPTPRHRVYRELCGLLRICPAEVRDNALRDLESQAQGPPGPRSTHRVLSAAGITQLSQWPLIDVGAHSATHPTLAALSRDEQKREILSSKSVVAALTERKTSAFAYPFGTSSDYSKATVDIVRDAGFSCACAAVPGRIGSKVDPLQLPRLLVRNWEGAEFRDRLLKWA